tara:strand:+ start:1060 stop:2331 length:1272 start_codon:yes stop_codon:yes gene_type:complete
MADVKVNIKAVDQTSAGFATANRNLKRFSNSAKQTTQGLLGTISGAGLGSALGSAIGLNLQSIATGVARVLSGVTKEVEKAYEDIESLSTQRVDLFVSRMRARLTDEQKLKQIAIDRGRAEAKLKEIKQEEYTEAKFLFGEIVGHEKKKKDLTAMQLRDQQQILLNLEILAGEEEQLKNTQIDRLEALKDKLKEVEEQTNKSMAPLVGVTLKGTQQLEALREQYGGLLRDLEAIRDLDSEDALTERIEKTKKLGVVATSLHAAELRALQAQRDAAKILGQGFERAIVNGEKFSDVLKQIGKDLMQLLIRRSITNPLVDAIGGFNFNSLLGIFGGGKAIGGPVSGGSAYMVGENGPEMFMPTQSGNIVSNSAMSGMGGSTYYIDARGADRSGLARLEQMINQTQASIRPIALASVVNASARGII